jgi:hypothetical protein
MPFIRTWADYLRTDLVDAEARIAKLEAAVDAAHYYIDASDRELSEAGKTREEALLDARVARAALEGKP